MEDSRVLLQCRLAYSYSQVMVFDSGERQAGNYWLETHVAQGFARRERTVAFGTLDEFGVAEVRVMAGTPRGLSRYARAIAVCITCDSGRLAVKAPDEHPCPRFVEIGPGVLEIICAQTDEGGKLQIDLYVRAVETSTPSAILKADPGLHPPPVLLEWANMA